MTTGPETQLFHSLPARLAEVAFRHGAEAAWRKEEAKEVIAVASSNGFATIGIEIWLPGKVGPWIPMPYFYGWTAPESDISDWREYCSRLNREAAEYIEHFTWDPLDLEHQAIDPLFNLTFASRDPAT